MNPLHKLAIDRFTVAAPMLLEPNSSRRVDGKSLILFGGGAKPSLNMLEALSAGAAEVSRDLIYMVFDVTNVGNGPTSLMLLQTRDGVHFVTADCHFWSRSDEGRFVIVPRQSKTNKYFELEDTELVQRQGPLVSAFDNDGFVRAAARLPDTAAAMPGGQGTVLGIDYPPSF